MHEIIRMVEVLPAPFGPRNPNDSPRSMSKSTPSTAMNSPNRLVRPRPTPGRPARTALRGARSGEGEYDKAIHATARGWLPESPGPPRPASPTGLARSGFRGQGPASAWKATAAAAATFERVDPVGHGMVTTTSHMASAPPDRPGPSAPRSRARPGGQPDRDLAAQLVETDDRSPGVHGRARGQAARRKPAAFTCPSPAGHGASRAKVGRGHGPPRPGPTGGRGGRTGRVEQDAGHSKGCGAAEQGADVLVVVEAFEDRHPGRRPLPAGNPVTSPNRSPASFGGDGRLWPPPPVEVEPTVSATTAREPRIPAPPGTGWPPPDHRLRLPGDRRPAGNGSGSPR